MNNKILILTLAHVLLISANLQAADAMLSFEEMDGDANGYISMDEAKAAEDIADNFKRIDSNNDGSINITEFQKYMGKGRVTPPEEMETSEPGAAPY